MQEMQEIQEMQEMQEIQERPQAGDGEATALSVARLPRALCSPFSVLRSPGRRMPPL